MPHHLTAPSVLLALAAAGCAPSIDVDATSASSGDSSSSTSNSSSSSSGASSSSGSTGPAPQPEAWSKVFGGLTPVGVAADAEGNVVFAANAWGEVDLGSGPVKGHVVVVKLDPSGALLWSAAFRSDQQDIVSSLAVDALGRVTFAGLTTGASIDFGGGALSAAVPVVGHTDSFLVRLDGAGHHVWSTRINSVSNGGGLDHYVDAGAIAIDASGGVVLSGVFAGTIALGGALLEPGPEGQGYNGLLARFDAGGKLAWSHRVHGSDAAALPEITGLAVDATGAVVVAGSFFGSLVAGSTTWPSAGSEDGFLMRLAPGGEVLWSRRLGGPGQDRALSMALDASGGIYVSGFFNDGADFGQGPVSANGPLGLPFVAAFDPIGTLRFIEPLAEPETVGGYALGVAVEPSGKVIAVVDPSNNANLMRVATIDPVGQSLASLRTFTADPKIYGAAIAAEPSGQVLCAGTLQGSADLGTGPLSSGMPWERAMFLAKMAP